MYGQFTFRVEDLDEYYDYMPSFRGEHSNTKAKDDKTNLSPILSIILNLLEYDFTYPEAQRLLQLLEKLSRSHGFSLSKKVKGFGKAMESMFLLQNELNSGENEANDIIDDNSQAEVSEFRFFLK